MASLPSIRISDSTKLNIDRAVKKFNQTSLVKLSCQQFRRLSYTLLSQMIIQDFDIPIQILPKQY